MLYSSYRDYIIPFFEIRVKGRKTYQYWKELRETQWWSPQRLQDLQFARLKSLLEHCYENCSYYREQWRTLGIEPSDIGSMKDFERIPLLTKGQIREYFDSICSSVDHGPLISKSTGGSTGEPLAFALNSDSNDRRVAMSNRGYEWAGAEPGTRQVYFWGVPLGNRPWYSRFKEYVYNTWLLRRHVINSFNIKESNYLSILREYNSQCANAIVAYVNPLYQFARWINENNLNAHTPRSIVVGAEPLHDFQRNAIENAFQCPVFETYGSREFMLIGAECQEHNGLHLSVEHLCVEILDDDGTPTVDGEEGNVVITDLFNYGMPFVRYMTGDRAVAGFGMCRCGRGLPTVSRISGRQLDVIHTPDGRKIPGEFFPHLIKDFPHIRRFQITQNIIDRIDISIEVDDRWDSSIRNSLYKSVIDILGTQIQVEVSEVDAIPLTRSGKHKVVVSNLDHENTQLRTN